MAEQIITQEYLQSIFDYNNGNLYWKVAISRKTKIGNKAGCLRPDGYVKIGVNGKDYLGHRLIYLYHYGYLPKLIDHKDANPSNCCIENLRAASNTENVLNAKISKKNTSGLKNVHWHKQGKKWQVKISVDGKVKSFGLYKDLEFAKTVAETMRNKHHKEFTNHG
jgi:hypothetical protein